MSLFTFKNDSNFIGKLNEKRNVILIGGIVILGFVLITLYSSNISQKKQNHLQAQASESQPVILEHPRILFSKDELSQIKLRALSTEQTQLGISYANTTKSILSAADSYVAKPFTYSVTFSCEQGGTRTYTYTLSSTPPASPVASECYFPIWTNLVRALMRRIEILSLAHILTATNETAQTKYFTTLQNEIRMIRSWNVWHDPQDRASLANLDTAYITRAVALMYDLTYSSISPVERTQIENALMNKGINPMFNKLCPPPTYRCSPERYEHSPNPLFFMSGSLGIATVAIYDRIPERRDQLLEAFNTNLNYTINNLVPIQGGSYEDFGYLTAFDYIIEGVNALELNNLSVAASSQMNEYIENTANVIISSLDNTGFTPNINDGVRTRLSDFSIFLFYNLRKNNNSNAQIIAAIKKFPSRFNAANHFLLWYDNHYISDQTELAWDSQFFKEAGLGVLKNSIDPQSVTYVKTPPLKYTNHQHFDIGGINYLINGTCIICDPGRPKNTIGFKEYGISTLGHNSVLIDQQPQNWTIKGNASMIDRPRYTAFKINMTSNYDNLNNENILDLKNISRILMSIKGAGNDFVILLDYFKAGKSHVYSQLFHNKDAQFSWNQIEKKLLIDTNTNDASLIFLSSPDLTFELKTPPSTVPSDFDGKFAALSTSIPSVEAYSGALIFKEPVEILVRQNDLLGFNYRGVEYYLIFNPSKIQKVFIIKGKRVISSSAICVLQNDSIINFDGPCTIE